MPYSRKRYGTRKTSATRKGTRRAATGRTRGSYRKGKYAKISRKRSSWQSGSTVSPNRRFVFADESYAPTALTNVNLQSQYIFRGNSLFDPDYSGVGAQPYGYDQLCPVFYNNYNVKSCKITVYPSVAAAYVTGFPPYIEVLVVPYRGNALPYTDPNDVRRMPYCRSMRISPTSQANGINKISSYASTKAILGREFASDVSATGQYDGNPTYTWYWFVIFDTASWVPTAPIPVSFDVKIAYYTKLLRKQELDQS